MSRRPTIRDQARETGVSVATLNNRHKVREATAQLLTDHPNLVGIYSAGAAWAV